MLYEVRKTTVGSAGGMLWILASPLLLLASYFFLISVLDVDYDAPGGKEGALLVLFSGLIPWVFAARSVTAGLTSLVSHASLMKQINFPGSLLPWISIGAVSVDLLVGMGLLAGTAIALGFAAPTLALLVPVSLLLALSAVALAALLGPLAVALPDARKLAPPAMRLGLLLSPVLYLPHHLRDNGFEAVLYGNPMAYFIGLARYAVFGEDDMLVMGVWADLGVVAGFALLLTLLARLAGARARRRVEDLL